MTLFDKIWDQHVVTEIKGGRQVLYIDQHYIHEVTSPQAFAGLEKRGITLRRRDKILATADHNVPTKNQHLPISEPLSKKQVNTLMQNCEKFDVTCYGLGHEKQGIVHVIGPELGVTKPGMTIVCGDSHTSTHGAFGCIAFGIGTSQVEQVMATQSLILNKPKTMKITVNGRLQRGVSSKDIVLYIISELTAAGGTGHFIEFAGNTITDLSMEARMTICNMSIEMGARGGLIAPDEKTFQYIKGREHAPKGEKWDEAVASWKALFSDADAVFDTEHIFNAEDISPMLTYGTNPGMGIKIENAVPQTDNQKALDYMGLIAGKSLIGMKVEHVFIGSCTNSRIEDLRLVADYVKGKQKADHISAMIVPGSKAVEAKAIEEGLDIIFKEAGFELREPGCSACLGMNEDKVPAGEYCVSTSNRNFEGRQGPGARTILASPLTAAATAVAGVIVDVRTELLN
ncbi:MAG: 3-isopropylmalate/(R)-2-methylmalate dehydratase large subunit [Saprospiraceae bacterium]|jgi:3-isopropylmalate/(R)-2-methylmalate dehydratase large subunit